MTVKEAILTLNANAVIACERAGFSSVTVKMIEDALDTIEDALKVQEPMEPVLDIDTWKCGDCRHTLENQQLLGDNVLLHEQYNYCPECGQEVKWE